MFGCGRSVTLQFTHYTINKTTTCVTERKQHTTLPIISCPVFLSLQYCATWCRSLPSPSKTRMRSLEVGSHHRVHVIGPFHSGYSPICIPPWHVGWKGRIQDVTTLLNLTQFFFIELYERLTKLSILMLKTQSVRWKPSKNFYKIDICNYYVSLNAQILFVYHFWWLSFFMIQPGTLLNIILKYEVLET